MTVIIGTQRDICEQQFAGQDARRESENLTVGIINFLPDATFVIDKEGKVIAWNLAMEEMTGVRAEEMMGKGGYSYAVPFYGTKRPLLIDLALREGNKIEAEYAMFKRHGDRVVAEVYIPMLQGGSHLSATARALRNTRGEIVGAIESIRDITEKKRLEETLQESEKRYREIFENSIDGFFQSSPEGRYMSVNPAFARMAGYDGPEQMMREITDIARQFYVNPEKRDLGKEIFEKKGYNRSSNIPFRRKDGTIFWGSVAARAVRDKAGVIVRYEGIVRDITERRRAEEAVRTSEANYRAIFNAANDAIFIHDIDTGAILDINDRMLEMYGYSREEALNLDVGKISSGQPPYTLQSSHEWGKKARDGEPQIFEWRYKHKNGSLFWGEVNLKRAVIGGKERMLAVVRDITGRKLAERAVRDSEERFNLFMDQLPGVVFIKDHEGRYLFVNRYYEQHRGHRREEIYGRTDHELWPHEDAVGFQETDHRVMTEGCDIEIMEPVSYADGKEHIQRTVKFPLLKEGSPAFLAGIGLDITEQVKAEEKLRESEERYRRLYESMTDAVVTTDLKGRIQDSNRAYQKMLGYSGEELQRMTYTDLTPKKWHFFEVSIVREQVLAQGYSDIYEKEYRRKDGRVFPVELRIFLIRDKSGEPSRMWAIVRDITERKSVEKALRESEERYRLVVENANDAIFIAQDGRIKFLTPRVPTITGYSAEELRTKHISDFIAPEDRDWVFERHQRRLRGETVPSPYEFRIATKACEVRWMDVNAVLIEWEGRPATLNFMRDITARRHLETALMHAQKMEAVGTLAGGVAHDFNNLLQGIQGYTELLLLDKNAGDKGYMELQEIFRAACKGAELTRQLLTFSRKVESRLRPVDLNREVLNVTQLLRRTIPKMIEIELRLAPELRQVNADANQIEQVLMNLAVNAKDAMPEGGRLTIETTNVTLDEKYCMMHLGANPGEHLLLSVADTGCGMDRETLEHIFEPFYTTKGVGKGTGLGLAMVYGIVKSHGGYIMCYSEVGVGTTFKIYLPAITDAAEQGEVKKDAPLRGGTETILLVEDEESIRLAGETILSRFGYRVLTAADGETALATYRGESNRIDLIILDLIMPGMGGMRCLEKILEFNPHAKVLIASGHSATGPIRETMDAGARGFVNKPYTMREMLTAVRTVLERG